jgi:SAM-dependent methyltransferase
MNTADLSKSLLNQNMHLDQLSGRFTDLSYSMRRYYIDDFHLRYTARLPKSSLVLNLGGHKEIQRGQFDINRCDLSVIHVDISRNTSPDVQADALNTPFLAEVFDAVVCSELLEHVYNPARVIQEAYYCLKPRGLLHISVPFLFPVHKDPSDYGRYTGEYWNKLLESTCFECLAIETQGLYYSVVVMFLKQHIKRKKLSPLVRIAAVNAVAKLQKWVITYEQKHYVKNNHFLGRFTTGYGIVARKLM